VLKILYNFILINSGEQFMDSENNKTIFDLFKDELEHLIKKHKKLLDNNKIYCGTEQNEIN